MEGRNILDAQEGGEGGAYAWEQQYKRSWDLIQEDEHGRLAMSAWKLQEQLKRRRQQLQGQIQRGIIRHVLLVVDLSAAMEERDFKPSYLEATVSNLRQFVLEFFDQNPISQLGLLATKDGLAQKLSDMSGNLSDHLRILDELKDLNQLKGQPSLQNALELGRVLLSHVPSHGSKELLFIYGSLTSRDPGDIRKTIEHVRRDKIQCSIVSLSAEVHLCRLLCKETGGAYKVAMNQDHFKDCLWEWIPPPPLTLDHAPTDLILMGFPSRTHQKLASLCACHQKPSLDGYECPRCASKICNIPTDCVVCGLKLISSPHLARSYHHLFPVRPFQDLGDKTEPVQSHSQATARCYSCHVEFLPQPAPTSPIQSTAQSASSADVRSRKFECAQCGHCFCYDCDIFIHESLHNCPGCVYC